jgi:putative membrane protein
MRGERRRNPTKGLIAGLAGGLVASWAMNQFQFVWGVLSRGCSTPRGAPTGDDTTVKAASAVSRKLLRRELTEKEKRAAGPLVHYAFGTAVGGLYGLIAEKRPKATSAGGLSFGVVFWLIADETAVPLLGLSKPPDRYPVSVHLYALASHLVFGATADLVRRSVRERL